MSRQSGFRLSKPGKIHMRCPGCGRKQSNMDRSEYDHPTAYMMELLCDKCDAGTKDAGIVYYDSRGRELSPWFVTAPRAGGLEER